MKRRNLVFGVILLLCTLAPASVVAPGNKTGKGGSSPLTTKGDIYTFGTSDCRLPVGANGTIVMADSAQTCGVKFASPGAGSGNVTSINADTTAAVTLTAGTAGTDFAIVDNAAGDHLFNIPSASATARGLVTTGAQVVAGAKNLTGAQLNTTSGDSLTLQGGGGGAGIIKFKNTAASGHYNWLLGGQFNADATFEITPSTAADGNTFSTPVFKVSQPGAGSLTGVMTAAGFYSAATPQPSAGTIRLANVDSIAFRDSTNAANYIIGMEGATGERFTFNNAFLISKSVAGLLRTVQTNGSSSASAINKFTLSTNAGDFNLSADSLASSGTATIQTDNTFVGGMLISTNGGGNLTLGTAVNGLVMDKTSGALKLAAYGVGVLTADASGNITSTAAGTGNVAGQASSVDSEIALFSGTGGKTIKRATGTGFVKATSGVFSTGTIAGSDLPNPSASTLGGVESLSSISHNFLTSISTSGVPTQAAPVFADLANMTGFVEQMTGFILTGANQSYTLDESAAYAYTINTFIVESSAGTITFDLKIAGTDVTGCSAISVSSTPATGTCSAANAVSIGNKVTVTGSSNSSAVNIGFTEKTTR